MTPKVKSNIIEYLISQGETPDKTDSIARLWDLFHDKYSDYFDNLKLNKKKYNIPHEKSDSDPELTDYNNDLDNYVSDSVLPSNLSKKIISLNITDDTTTQENKPDSTAQEDKAPSDDDSDDNEYTNTHLTKSEMISILEARLSKLENELFALNHRIDLLWNNNGSKTYHFNFN